MSGDIIPPKENISDSSTILGNEVFLPDMSLNSEDAGLDKQLVAQIYQAGYELGFLIGKGAFARVYCGLRLTDKKRAAVKILDQRLGMSGAMRTIFAREMQVLTSLSHKNIACIFDTGSSEHVLPWYAMEFVNGPNLERLVQMNGGALVPKDACNICVQVLEALQHIHEVPPPEGPFVHRDIKPRNILVTGGPGAFTAKLSDFGLAKNFEKAGFSGISQTGNVTGTFVYMPPEQLRDSKYVGPEVDLYAMGCVLYFCLSGSPMYDVADTTRPSILVQAIVRGSVVPLKQRCPSLPESIQRLVEKSTARDPEERFRSAQEMLAAFNAVLQEMPN